MPNGLEYSQDDRIPRGVGQQEEFYRGVGPWTRIRLNTGGQLHFLDVPMIDPANVIGTEGAEVTIRLEINLNLHLGNTGVNVFLFGLDGVQIADRLWHSQSPDSTGPGHDCRATDVWTIRMSAQDFFGIREVINQNPQWNPERVYFQVVPIGSEWAMCGSSPGYVDSQARIDLKFDYLTFAQFDLDLRLWDEDLCQNMVMVPTYDEGNPFPDLLSTHLTRVMAKSPTPTAEVCKHHSAEVVIDKDGFAKGFYCGKSWPTGASEYQRNYYADAYVVQDKDDVLSGQVPKGMTCFLGSYHAPKWTEAQLWSHRHFCTIII